MSKMADIEFLRELRVDMLGAAQRTEGRRGLVSRIAGMRRRNLVILVVLGVVLAGCAGAAHSRVFQLIGINEAPSVPDAQTLLDQYPWPHGLHVDRARARVIFEQREPVNFDHDGPTSWATGVAFIAPLSDGKLCEFQESGGGSIDSCVRPGKAALTVLSTLGPIAWRDSQNSLHDASYALWGLAAPKVHRITLVGPGTSTLNVPISVAHLPGQKAWAVHISPRMLRPGGAPTELVARNAAGLVVGRARVDPRWLVPTVFNRSPVIRSAPVHNPRPAIETGTLLRIHVAGHLHSISLDVEQGQQCMTDQAGVLAEMCGAPSGFAPQIQPLEHRAAVGWGLAPQGSAHVDVVYAHHESPAVVRGGYYLFGISTAELAAGDVPLRVVARDAHGRVIATHRFTDRSVFPGY